MSAGFKYAEAKPVSPIPRLLRDAPEYASFPPHVLETIAWSYRYSGAKDQGIDDIRRSVTALEAWIESERRHDARRREESRRVWREYHLAAAARHTSLFLSLIEHHEREAERYRSAEGAA